MPSRRHLYWEFLGGAGSREERAEEELGGSSAAFSPVWAALPREHPSRIPSARMSASQARKARQVLCPSVERLLS